MIGESEALSRARILVVDDEPANVRLLERVLQSGGFQDVRGTTDSRQAMAIAEEMSPDLVMLDLQMPHLDGFQVLERLRERYGGHDYLPVLVLTADTAREARERALAGGAMDFLTKPFDRTEVLLRTRNLLETRRLHLALRAQNRSLEARVAHQELHDSLTGLPNRALFRDRVETALARTARSERCAVMLLDVDHLASVNEAFSHTEGDRLLVAVAGRLLAATRGCDSVARVGGGEFAVLVSGLADEESALIVARRILGALARPLDTPGALSARDGVSARIGVAFPQEGDWADELLRNAHLAMNRAKTEGKGRYTVYEPGMHLALVERLEMEAELRTAVERGEILVVYQPIVELAAGAVTGVEALARWRRPGQATPPSASFIPVAEATGLIVPIGRWILREACRDARRWLWEDGVETRTLSVNLSPRQLEDADIVGDVAAALEETGFPPERLTLEITESVLVSDTERVIARLHELRALGVRLAIDDFGAGYCSLGYLQRMPFEILKIDRSFVTHVADRLSDQALARSIVNLAATLGLHTVAEGVESEEQRSQLLALGCAHAQGYLFSRPAAPEALRALLREGCRPPGAEGVVAPPRR